MKSETIVKLVIGLLIALVVGMIISPHIFKENDDQTIVRLVKTDKVVTKAFHEKFLAAVYQNADEEVAAAVAKAKEEAKEHCLVEVNAVIVELKAENLLPSGANVRFSLQDDDQVWFRRDKQPSFKFYGNK